MAKNPATVAAKWATNLSAAANNGTIQAGIQGVTVAPGQAAARQQDVWAQNVAAAKSKWATNVAGVSLNAWQQAAQTKGLPRIASGADAAQSKFQGFMTQLISYQESQLSSLQPRGNLQTNIKRATDWITAMSKFQYNKAQS